MLKHLSKVFTVLGALYTCAATAAVQNYELSGEGFTVTATLNGPTTLALVDNQLIFNTNWFAALSPGNIVDTPPGRNYFPEEATYSFSVSLEEGYKLQSVVIGGTGSYILKNYNSELVTAQYNWGIASYVSGQPGEPSDYVSAGAGNNGAVAYESGSIIFNSYASTIVNNSDSYDFYTLVNLNLFAMHPTRPYYDHLGNLIPGSNGNSEVQVFLDNFYFEFNVVAVPEPSTYAMFGLGLGVLGFMSHRRKQGDRV